MFVGISLWGHYHRPLTATEVRFLAPERPFNVPVTHQEGTCFVDFSIADFGAGDAHRCFGRAGRESTIEDPCFNLGVDDGLTTTLACETSPWTPQVVLMRVKRWAADATLSKRHHFRVRTFSPRGRAVYKYIRFGAANTRKNLPWALDLGGGLHCILSQGASGLIRDLPKSYMCIHGNFLEAGWWKGAGWVVGLPDRRQAVWKVLYVAPGSGATTTEPVNVAWY